MTTVFLSYKQCDPNFTILQKKSPCVYIAVDDCSFGIIRIEQ